MALVVCKDCQKEFSTDAKACPHCGANKPKPPKKPMNRVLKYFLYAWFGMTVLILVTSALTNPSIQVAPANPQPTLEEAKKRLDGCQKELEKAYKAGMLYDIKAEPVPRVYVGDGYYRGSFDDKEAFAEALNCVFVKGKDGAVNYDLYDWQSGKRIARFSWGKLQAE